MKPHVPEPSVQAALAQWRGAVLADGDGGPAAFRERVLAAGVRYGDQPLCVVRAPLLLSPQVVATYRDALAHLRGAIQQARALLLADLDRGPESLAARIGVDAQTIALAQTDPGYPGTAVLARFDSYLLADDLGRPCPAFLELNAESPAGMAYDDALAAVFLSDPAARSLLPLLRPFHATRAAARAALTAWQQWRAGDPHRPVGAHAGGERPSVAIVDRAGVPTWPEFELFAEAFRALGLSCRVVAAEDLVFDGERLQADGAPIDLVYRRLLVADVCAAPDVCAPLLDAYHQHRVCVVNAFRNGLLHGKGLFALLHDPLLRRHLPPEIKATIDRTVPWTGILRDRPGPGAPADLRERVRREPESWVLKPLAGHGGRGVVLGHAVDLRTWQRAVDEADAHVVQRRVPAPSWPLDPALAPTLTRPPVLSLDPFAIRGRLAGFLCRLAPGPLANVAEGASQVPVFELDA
ncbi:MAG: hypothetical protein H6742_05195 [Alphaproteobacteria bacterium]|nr:hypothetical protein [Alphaproteobacteria bacterium]